MNVILALTENDFEVPRTSLTNTSIASILQIVFGVAAGVALVVLVIAALKYVLSQGDPAAVAKAKNTIVYALVGLAITAAAFSIVSFMVRAI